MRRDGSRGQALVEFCLVFPIFMLMFFGIIDGGRLVYTINSLSEAAREGARLGSVQSWTTDCPASSRSECITRQTLGRMTGVPGGITVTSTCTRTSGTGSVTVPADSCRPADRLTVVVSTPYTMFTPIIGQFFGTKTISATAQVAVNS